MAAYPGQKCAFIPPGSNVLVIAKSDVPMWTRTAVTGVVVKTDGVKYVTPLGEFGETALLSEHELTRVIPHMKKNKNQDSIRISGVEVRTSPYFTLTRCAEVLEEFIGGRYPAVGDMFRVEKLQYI